jgi:hypothetical protein
MYKWPPKNVSQRQLNGILHKHQLWLDRDPKGEQADFSYMDLSGANLTNIRGKTILTFVAGKDTAIYVEGQLQIGCIIMSVADWLHQYRDLVAEHRYTKEEIKPYVQFIRYCKLLTAGQLLVSDGSIDSNGEPIKYRLK